MAIYTHKGKEYLVTRDWLVGELHIPMDVITDAIEHAADDGFKAPQIETYIRDSMTLFKSTDAAATGAPPAEDISSENTENTEDAGPLVLVIDGVMHTFTTGPYSTLSDLATWISDTLNQAKEQVIKDYIAELEADLPRNITVKIEM